MGPQEIVSLLQTLTKAGIPLSQAGQIQIPGLGPLSSLLGVANSALSGNIPGAVGQAAGFGSQLAALTDMPGTSRVLGAAGGPISLATGLATGNPGQAALGATRTASSLSGAAGGPTLGTLAGGLGADILPVVGALLQSATQSGVQHKARQAEESRKASREFPGLVKDRVEGASLLDILGKDLSPDQVVAALQEATQGVRATNLAPDSALLSRGQGPVDGQSLGPWAEAAPDLEGKNWAAYLGLLDKSGASSGDNQRPVAYDISNAIAGIGQYLGIDWGSRGNDGRNQGYEISEEELNPYGFRPGNYLGATLNYLKTIDPKVVESPNWASLGVSPEVLNGQSIVQPLSPKSDPEPIPDNEQKYVGDQSVPDVTMPEGMTPAAEGMTPSAALSAAARGGREGLTGQLLGLMGANPTVNLGPISVNPLSLVADLALSFAGLPGLIGNKLGGALLGVQQAGERARSPRGQLMGLGRQQGVRAEDMPVPNASPTDPTVPDDPAVPEGVVTLGQTIGLDPDTGLPIGIEGLSSLGPAGSDGPTDGSGGAPGSGAGGSTGTGGAPGDGGTGVGSF